MWCYDCKLPLSLLFFNPNFRGSKTSMQLGTSCLTSCWVKNLQRQQFRSRTSDRMFSVRLLISMWCRVGNHRSRQIYTVDSGSNIRIYYHYWDSSQIGNQIVSYSLQCNDIHNFQFQSISKVLFNLTTQ